MTNEIKKIFIGCDHAGFPIKEYLKRILLKDGYEVIDRGAYSEESVDYPDYAHQVAKDVSTDKNALGVLVCGSGNGICMTANKHNNIRAALCWNAEIAELARLHNDANIICIPGRFVTESESESILKVFLKTDFEGGRHQKRIEKINI